MENIEDELPIQEPSEERTYTVRERALRDLWVGEYLVDYDALGATLRVGYGKSIAKEYAAKIYNESYVQREIVRREGLGVVNSDTPENKEKEKRIILAGLRREANYRGPGSSQSARVAALSKLAQLAEMEPVRRSSTELYGPDGQPIAAGVFVVPGIMTPEEWAAAALAQQEALTSPVPAGEATVE